MGVCVFAIFSVCGGRALSRKMSVCAVFVLYMRVCGGFGRSAAYFTTMSVSAFSVHICMCMYIHACEYICKMCRLGRARLFYHHVRECSCIHTHIHTHTHTHTLHTYTHAHVHTVLQRRTLSPPRYSKFRSNSSTKTLQNAPRLLSHVIHT